MMKGFTHINILLFISSLNINKSYLKYGMLINEKEKTK